MSETWTASSGKPPSRPKRNRLPWILLIGAIVLALGGGAAWYLSMDRDDGDPIATPVDPTETSPPSTPAETEVVAEFTGSGSDTTDSFDVEGTWYVAWENQGATFRMAISGDHDFGVVVRQQEPGSGRVQSVAPGTYQLEVIAQGRWSAEILQEVPGESD